MNSKHTQAQMEYMVNHPGRYFFATFNNQRTILARFQELCPAATIKGNQVVIGVDHIIQVGTDVRRCRGIELTNYWVDETAELSQADIAFLESRVR